MTDKRRRSIRLRGYDYTQPGGYFVTVCTHNREHLFGEVVDGEMQMNEFGRVVWEEWFRTAQVRPYVRLYPDELVVMPNHIHGIIWIVDDDEVGTHTVGAQRRCAPTPTPTTTSPHVVPGSLGAIIRAIKPAVTKRINALRGSSGAPVWQRNYWEHIIRTERASGAIRRYILDNPQRWELDRYNGEAIKPDPIAREIWLMLQAKHQLTTSK